MKIKLPYNRLLNKNFFKLVDESLNRFISDNISGGRILDLGCGYGSLVHHLNRIKGNRAIGIDLDEESISVAKKLFPDESFSLATLDHNIESNSFNYVILRDVLHHLKEDNLEKVIFEQIKRILKKDGKIIIFDPNVNLVLRISRKIMRHVDAECTFKEALTILKSSNYIVVKTDFTELFALPLSGGYVGICFVPRILTIQYILIFINRLFSRIISHTFLKKYILWRYLIVAKPI